eukprot:TRINITY_DN13474_c0_g1_i1.p1 TRINITY_DN13474_c0_g1~~TRINITY_DN13474_c0_g1_i1.p1  ORF type:complete len:418 (+),score=115.13 TRINITY_DN13474_c0_g1_i1:116-1369(+)
MDRNQHVRAEEMLQYVCECLGKHRESFFLREAWERRGEVNEELKRYEGALKYYGTALRDYRAYAKCPRAPVTDEHECRVLCGMGRCSAAIGDDDGALEYYGAALKMAQAQNEFSADVAGIVVHLSNVRYAQGFLKAALTDYTSALKIYAADGDEAKQAVALCCIGNVHRCQGEYDKALARYSEAVRLEEAASPGTLSIAATYHSIGLTHLGRGAFSEAEQWLRKALALRVRLALGGVEEAASNVGLGNLQVAQGKGAEGLVLLRLALATRQKASPGRMEEAECHYCIGVALAQGKDPAAGAAFDAANALVARAANGGQPPEIQFWERMFAGKGAPPRRAGGAAPGAEPASVLRDIPANVQTGFDVMCKKHRNGARCKLCRKSGASVEDCCRDHHVDIIEPLTGKYKGWDYRPGIGCK